MFYFARMEDTPFLMRKVSEGFFEVAKAMEKMPRNAPKEKSMFRFWVLFSF